VHLQVFGKVFDVVILQEKGPAEFTVRTVMKKGKTSITPAQCEADVLIEPLRELEVAGGKMNLDFDCDEIWHGVALFRWIGSVVGS
jgi:hypothetical protein